MSTPSAPRKPRTVALSTDAHHATVPRPGDGAGPSDMTTTITPTPSARRRLDADAPERALAAGRGDAAATPAAGCADTKEIVRQRVQQAAALALPAAASAEPRRAAAPAAVSAPERARDDDASCTPTVPTGRPPQRPATSPMDPAVHELLRSGPLQTGVTESDFDFDERWIRPVCFRCAARRSLRGAPLPLAASLTRCGGRTA